MRIKLTIRAGQLEKFEHMVKQIPIAAHDGAVEGIEMSLEKWQEKSRQNAMYDTGHLHDEIEIDPVAQVGAWLDLEGTIRNDAYNGTYMGQPFNYAVYWYDKNPGFTKSGGDPRTIDNTGEANADMFFRTIENKIIAAWRKAGW